MLPIIKPIPNPINRIKTIKLSCLAPRQSPFSIPVIAQRTIQSRSQHWKSYKHSTSFKQLNKALQKEFSTMAQNSFPPQEVRAVLGEVTGLLKERGESVGVGETAAGGIISASLLSTPGASGFYKGGLTLYTLESRIAFAGWTQANIQNYKGPTKEVVAGLADNIREKLGSTYVIAESGTAGPTGGTTPNRTPGFLALAISTPNGTYTKDLSTGLGGEREKNMVAFAVEALTFLRDVIKGDAKL